MKIEEVNLMCFSANIEISGKKENLYVGSNPGGKYFETPLEIDSELKIETLSDFVYHKKSLIEALNGYDTEILRRTTNFKVSLSGGEAILPIRKPDVWVRGFGVRKLLEQVSRANSELDVALNDIDVAATQLRALVEEATSEENFQKAIRVLGDLYRGLSFYEPDLHVIMEAWQEVTSEVGQKHPGYPFAS